VPVTGSQARPAIAGAKPRVTRDRNAPPWEPPARHEAYPTIRGRVSLPRIPRALILAAALLIAALLIFLAPSFFAGGGTASPTPSASRTPGATAAASGSPVATVTPAPPSGQEPTVYTVVANDTVSGIAAKFGVTVEALLAANPQIKDPNQIAVGDKITIPPKGSPTPAKATPKPT
jgi:LysM repeat protein